eukprot:3194166-Rhodomonas_salina.1
MSPLRSCPMGAREVPGRTKTNISVAYHIAESGQDSGKLPSFHRPVQMLNMGALWVTVRGPRGEGMCGEIGFELSL